MSEHAKEGWSAHGSAVYFPEGIGGFDLRNCPHPEANARRIAACINACQGLSTADLEQTGLVSAVGYQLINMEALNAELLEALENMANEFQRIYPIYYYAEPWGHETNAPLLAAKVLIAKARSAS